MLLRPSKEKNGAMFAWFNEGFERSTNKYMKIINKIVRKRSTTLGLFSVLLAATKHFFVGAMTGR